MVLVEGGGGGGGGSGGGGGVVLGVMQASPMLYTIQSMLSVRNTVCTGYKIQNMSGTKYSVCPRSPHVTCNAHLALAASLEC